MHARRIHTSVAAPASSPKLRPKKAKLAAEATSYDQVATEERISCAGSKDLADVGEPNEEECDSEKEPREGENPDGRPKTE